MESKLGPNKEMKMTDEECFELLKRTMKAKKLKGQETYWKAKQELSDAIRNDPQVRKFFYIAARTIHLVTYDAMDDLSNDAPKGI